MQLEFKINKQMMLRLDSEKPVEGSKAYLYAKFNFSDDWVGLTKKAYFKQEGYEPVEVVIPEDGLAVVPSTVIKPSHFSLAVKGFNGGIEKLVTSNVMYVSVLKTMFTEGSTIEPITGIETDTLEHMQRGEVVTLNIPNSYGTSLEIEQDKQTGIITFKLIGRDKKVIDVKTLDLDTEKIIDRISLDYANKKIVFLLTDGTRKECDISELIDNLTNLVNDEKARAELAEQGLRDALGNETQEREKQEQAISQRIADEEVRAKGVEDNIKKLIPPQANEINKLADKNFVNSSIETASATPRGTFTSLAQLKATYGNLNDYAYLQVLNPDGTTLRFDKYKHNGIEWIYEYPVNNSGFTSAQWSAINSGITNEQLTSILHSLEDLGSSIQELDENTQVDEQTISRNQNNQLQSIGSVLLSGGIQFYWFGTTAEYDNLPQSTKDDSRILFELNDDLQHVLFEVDGNTIEFSPEGFLRIPNNMDLCFQSVNYGNGESGYRKYRNGWLEQWGVATSGANGEVEFNLHQPYRDQNFSLFIEPREKGNFFHYAVPSANQKFKTRIQTSAGDSIAIRFQWKSQGYWR